MAINTTPQVGTEEQPAAQWVKMETISATRHFRSYRHKFFFNLFEMTYILS